MKQTITNILFPNKETKRIKLQTKKDITILKTRFSQLEHCVSTIAQGYNGSTLSKHDEISRKQATTLIHNIRITLGLGQRYD